ncbi:hypothetical protein BU583_02590 [Staphylococcus agnetis]|uniref:hypothetical protein n=1 Tax=Staphylococcus agnetis TaxID=985762 RepID=UPI000D19E884|nr:hypothetical protein [Staphylococcus agnetis]PTH63612.1 hypothetical protein BU583_02590 [Staphylococcus agnetis]
MESFKKYWHLYLLAMPIFIFSLAVVIESIFKIEFQDCLMISISFLGIFATFGGAYLGAKIAGDNALKLKEKEIEYERKKDYIAHHYEMLSDLQKKGWDTTKSELKKWNDNLLKEDEQIYACVFQIKVNLEVIKRIPSEVEITDKHCANKFEEVQKNVEIFKKKNYINEVTANLDQSGKERINKYLKENKGEIFKFIKKIEYIIEEIPKYDKDEVEKGLT